MWEERQSLEKKQIIGDLGPSNENGRLLNEGKGLKNM